MATQTNLPIVAVFSNRGSAEAAVDELWHAGFAKEKIGLAARGESLHQATTATAGLEENAASGASKGALTGSAVGAVAGAIAAATIPGFGPVLAGGLLWGLVGGAATGAALGTFAGPFVAMGLSAEDAQKYEDEFRAGRTLVVVRTDDRREEAWTILRAHGPAHAEMAGKDGK